MSARVEKLFTPTRRPESGATAAAWAEFVTTVRNTKAEIQGERIRIEDQRLLADDIEEFSRIGQRLGVLDAEVADVNVILLGAEDRHDKAVKREADEREAARIASFDSFMRARSGTILRADSIIAQFVECVHEVEQHEAAALAFTTPATLARVREEFERGQRDLFPLLLRLLQGRTCALGMGEYELPWAKGQVLSWSAICGLRPPAPEPAHEATEPAPEPETA